MFVCNLLNRNLWFFACLSFTFFITIHSAFAQLADTPPSTEPNLAVDNNGSGLDRAGPVARYEGCAYEGGVDPIAAWRQARGFVDPSSVEGLLSNPYHRTGLAMNVYSGVPNNFTGHVPVYSEGNYWPYVGPGQLIPAEQIRRFQSDRDLVQDAGLYFSNGQVVATQEPLFIVGRSRIRAVNHTNCSFVITAGSFPGTEQPGQTLTILPPNGEATVPLAPENWWPDAVVPETYSSVAGLNPLHIPGWHHSSWSPSRYPGGNQARDFGTPGFAYNLDPNVDDRPGVTQGLLFANLRSAEGYDPLVSGDPDHGIAFYIDGELNAVIDTVLTGSHTAVATLVAQARHNPNHFQQGPIQVVGAIMGVPEGQSAEYHYLSHAEAQRLISEHSNQSGWTRITQEYQSNPQASLGPVRIDPVLEGRSPDDSTPPDDDSTPPDDDSTPPDDDSTPPDDDSTPPDDDSTPPDDDSTPPDDDSTPPDDDSTPPDDDSTPPDDDSTPGDTEPTTIRYEAESMTLLGSVSVIPDAAASGQRAVADTFGLGQGIVLSEAPQASEIRVRYASEFSGSISYTVGEEDGGKLQFTATGAWVGEYQEVSAEVDIPSGAEFSIVFQTGDTAMNIDYVEFIGSSSEEPDGDSTPPSGSPSMGFNIPSNATAVLIGQNSFDEYEQYIEVTGSTPAGSSHYGSLYSGTIRGGSDANNQAHLNSVYEAYPESFALVAINIKDNPSEGGFNSVPQALIGVNQGVLDENIDRFAETIRSQPERTFLLRIGYEVTTNIFGGDDNYANAFNYIANRLRNVQELDNVAFVFHPHTFSDTTALYPGDEFVDLVAFSFFNSAVCMPLVNFTFCSPGDRLNPDRLESIEWVQEQGKPIMIAESSPRQPAVGNREGFIEYLDRLFDVVEQYDIRFLTYISSDWPSQGWPANEWGNSQLDSISGVSAAWNTHIADSRYLDYSDIISL